MTPFYALPPTLSGLIRLWSVAVMMCHRYDSIRYRQLGKKGAVRWFSLSMVVLNVAFFYLLQQQNHPEFLFWFVIPTAWTVVFLGLSTLIGAVAQFRISGWHRNHISAMSVHEVFDGLPAGLCYYRPDGLPILVNEKMRQIGLQLYGTSLINGETLWHDIRTGRFSDGMLFDNAPILRTHDGRVYSFCLNELPFQGTRIYEMIASDITEEYDMTLTLEEKLKQAHIVNMRLKALMDCIEYVTMSRELLQIKAALHDSIGRSLLLARKYLSAPDQTDRRELLRLWQSNIRWLKNQEPETWQQPYYVIFMQADKLGIEIEIIGELPRETHLIPLIDTALSVHITNVLRHAGGTRATVSVGEEAGAYVLTFQNNGNPPRTAIRETGGLANLRQKTEAAGGQMNIKAEPAFEMVLRLPKENPYVL